MVILTHFEYASEWRLVDQYALKKYLSYLLLTIGFVFPKWPFGNTKVVYQSFQKSWFKEWPFLHYIEAKDMAFCHTCVTAVKLKKIRAPNAEASFVS